MRRLGWISFAITVGLIAGSLPLAMNRSPSAGEPLSVDDLFWIGGWLSLFAVGALIVSKRPSNKEGLILCGIGLSLGIGIFATDYGTYGVTITNSLPVPEWVYWLGNWAILGSLALLPLFFLFFPNGKLPSRRWRPFVWIVLAATGASILATALVPGPMGGAATPGNPLGIEALRGLLKTMEAASNYVLAASIVISLSAPILRYRRAVGDERQQLKWLAYVCGGVGVLIAAVVAYEGLVGTVNDFVATGLLVAALSSLSTSIGIAILKYRLYDIDVVINKTIVFGVLAAFITAVYVAIVVGIGTLLGSQDEPNLALSIAATAIVAIAFSPVKERTQRLANRLVYGRRRSPYEILSELSRTVATAPTPDGVLAGVAGAAALGVNADAATVTLLLHDGKRVKATHTNAESVDLMANDELFDVLHEDEALGTIAVHKRASDPVTPNDRRLLEDLSAQAGLALHNARLALELQARLDEISMQAEELQGSRARIVSAADDSRRRLENDITGGPRKDLVAMQGALDRARVAVEDDPDAAAVLLESLTEDVTTTLDELRELARGIYPPLLADKGVVTALEAHVRKRDLSVTIYAGDDVREARFDESVETTAYFCCVETLSDGGATAVDLVLADGRLRVTIERPPLDDGGERNLRDRIEARHGSLEHGPNGIAFYLPVERLRKDQVEASAHASSSSSGPN